MGTKEMVGSHEAKDWALAHLKGIFTSPSAPLTEDFKLDENGLISNAQRAIDCGARGVGFGFLDAWGFTIAQRKHAMKLIAETVRGQGLCTFYTTDHSRDSCPQHLCQRNWGGCDLFVCSLRMGLFTGYDV
jgi:hypothetical protein